MLQAEVRCCVGARGAHPRFPELLQLLTVVLVPLAAGFVQKTERESREHTVIFGRSNVGLM